MSHQIRRLTSRIGVPLVRGTIGAQLFKQTRRCYETASNSPTVREMYRTVREHPNSGLKYLGLAGALGLGAYISYSLSKPASYVPYSTRDMMSTIGGATFAQKIRSRIASTYGYLGGSIVLTGVTTYLLFSRGIGYRVLMANPWIYGIGTLIATFVSIQATIAIPYDTNPAAKHIAWACTNGLIGFSILGLSTIAGAAIIKQAAMITGLIMGGMSGAAMASPNDYFLQIGPYLGVGLGVVIAASLGGMFFPYNSLLMNVSLYGGLGLFGLMAAHDAQKVLHDAQVAPSFDPISEQMGLYLDAINIFVRVVQILMLQNSRRK